MTYHLPFQDFVREIEYREPADVLSCLGTTPGLVFLDSAMPMAGVGRWSWLAADPFARFTSLAGVAHWNGQPVDGHPIAALRCQLAPFQRQQIGRSLPFAGGATGYLAYEAGRLFERLPDPKWRGAACPEIDLWFHDCGIAFDVLARRAFLISTGQAETDPVRRRNRAEERGAELLDRIAAQPRDPAASPIAIRRDAWQPNMSPDEFRGIVERTRGMIRAGDIFQANLTQAWRARLPAGFDTLALYRQLRTANPAPFAALIVAPDRTIASTSPEGFLRLEGRAVETRPIKGTRRRSPDADADQRLAQELLASEKDRAENVMIVDLMRNDLSRICSPGTVEVPVLCGLESFASVHHLVSVVRGTLKPGIDALDLLSACFPGGSVTGAPKIRAMQIIHELEPEARGLYCGSIVHLGFDGSLRSSIAIRTLVVEDGTASIHAGGGITLLSDPDQEYQEAALKAERMLSAFDLPTRKSGP